MNRTKAFKDPSWQFQLSVTLAYWLQFPVIGPMLKPFVEILHPLVWVPVILVGQLIVPGIVALVFLLWENRHET